MAEVPLLDPEQQEKRQLFLSNLAAFLIEAGQNGWAAEAPRVESPQRPGFKELAYTSDDGEWEYRDSYAGYFMAPGSSVVYYKGKPAWYMTYGGEGQLPEHYDKAKETYAFLRKALMQPIRIFPVRGPERYEDPRAGLIYGFTYSGSLAVGNWRETIETPSRPVFSQRGDVGLIIDKNEQRNPVYPWNL